MKKLSTLRVYKWFIFSSTQTFGWYLSILSLWVSREHRYYNESRNINLFSFSYSKREGGITDNDEIWTGRVVSLELFFIRIFKYRHISSIRPLTADDLE